MFSGGFGRVREKKWKWKLVKMKKRKKVNSQQKKDLLLIFFSMHKKNENGGVAKSGQTDLLSRLSTKN